MRLVTYAAPADGQARAGVVRDGVVQDIQALLGGSGPSTMLAVLDDWDRVREAFAAARPGGGVGALGQVALLAPILYPRALFCAGANYTDHVAEMARILNLPDDGWRKEGDAPWHFVATPAHSVVGPGAAVERPAYCARLDWEVEIGVVIGCRARNVAVADAMACVAGLTVVNDLSARDHVFRPDVPAASPFHWDWMSQKCFTGAKPMGPWIVPLADIPDLADLAVRLWVNDRLMQDFNSRHMIFGIAEQVAHLSTRVTLLPGDVIATGTPASAWRTAPTFNPATRSGSRSATSARLPRAWCSPPPSLTQASVDHGQTPIPENRDEKIMGKGTSPCASLR